MMTPEDDSYYSADAATFGDRVNAAREILGISQAQLARRLGVKTATVRDWEEDRSEPRANKLQMLSGVLNVSMVWLLSGHGEGIDPTQDFGDESPDIREALSELQSIRIEQTRLLERIGRVEKRLRSLVG